MSKPKSVDATKIPTGQGKEKVVAEAEIESVGNDLEVASVQKNGQHYRTSAEMVGLWGVLGFRATLWICSPSNHWSSNHLGHLPRSHFCFALPLGYLGYTRNCSHILRQSFTCARMGQSPSMMRRRRPSFKSVPKRPLKAWLCTLKKGPGSSRECVASEEKINEIG